MKSTISRRAFLSNASIMGASGVLVAGGALTACSSGESNENKLIPWMR